MGLPSDGARVVNHCRACGSTEHGRPAVTPVPGRATPQVSISYAEDATVVALSGVGPVGVDVERRAAAAFRGFDSVASYAQEEHDETGSQAITWVRKESLLKATGHGLAVDPRRIRIAGPSQPPELIQWDAADPPDGPVWMQDVEITSAHVATVTVLAEERPELVVRKVGPAVRLE
jgi:4'-phosphopantetheinyl transferase